MSNSMYDKHSSAILQFLRTKKFGMESLMEIVSHGEEHWKKLSKDKKMKCIVSTMQKIMENNDDDPAESQLSLVDDNSENVVMGSGQEESQSVFVKESPINSGKKKSPKRKRKCKPKTKKRI